MPTTPTIVIQNISFDSDGDLHISYFRPQTDTKVAGLAHLHTLLVPTGFDYDDEIHAVIDAIDYLVRDVLDDWDTLEGPPEVT